MSLFPTCRKLASSVTTWPLQEPRRFWWQYLRHILVHEGSCTHPDATPGCHIAWIVTNVWSPLLGDGPFVTSTLLKSQSFDELPMDSPDPVWGQTEMFPFWWKHPARDVGAFSVHQNSEDMCSFPFSCHQLCSLGYCDSCLPHFFIVNSWFLPCFDSIWEGETTR